MWLSAIFCAPAIVASVWQKFRVVWYNRVSRTEKVSWEWNYVCCRCRGGVQHVHLSKVLVHISASLVSTMVGKLWALCFPSSFSCSALSLSPNPTHNANPNKLTSTLILTLILTMTLRPNQAHLGLPWNNDHNGSLLGNMSLLWQPLYSPTQNSSFWMIDEDGRLANRDADKMNKELQAEFKHKPNNLHLPQASCSRAVHLSACMLNEARCCMFPSAQHHTSPCCRCVATKLISGPNFQRSRGEFFLFSFCPSQSNMYEWWISLLKLMPKACQHKN